MDTQEQVDNLDVVKALGVHKNVSFIPLFTHTIANLLGIDRYKKGVVPCYLRSFQGIRPWLLIYTLFYYANLLNSDQLHSWDPVSS